MIVDFGLEERFLSVLRRFRNVLYKSWSNLACFELEERGEKPTLTRRMNLSILYRQKNTGSQRLAIVNIEGHYQWYHSEASYL